MVKKSRNMKKSEKITFFKQSENFEEKKNILQKEKNAILLVKPIEEISLRPELSTPPRFRIQGGYPERDIGVVIVVAGFDQSSPVHPVSESRGGTLSVT